MNLAKMNEKSSLDPVRDSKRLRLEIDPNRIRDAQSSVFDHAGAETGCSHDPERGLRRRIDGKQPPGNGCPCRGRTQDEYVRARGSSLALRLGRYRGGRSEQADGISDGIALTNHLKTVSVRDLLNKAGDDCPCRSDGSRQLPSTIVGIANGIDVA